MKLPAWAYYFVAAIVIFTGVAAAVYYGTTPRPLSKISYSHFTSPEDFGANIYKRLMLEINNTHLVFLGVQPDDPSHYLIWKGFLESIAEPNQFTTVIADNSLPEIKTIKIDEVISMKEDPLAVIAGVKKILSSDKRVAILAPTSFISYMIQNNFQTRLRQAIFKTDNKVFDVPWLNFSLSNFANSRAEENQVYFPCNTGNKDTNGFSDLGCMIITKSRANYRKKHIPNKYPGMLDQIGSKEYLALFNGNLLKPD